MTDDERRTARRTARWTARWIEQRSPTWRQVEAHLPEVEDRRHASPERVLDTMRSYRELARDLTVARRALPGSALARQLDRLYMRLHRSLFHPAGSFGHDLVRLFRTDVPAIAAELRLRILIVAIGFFLAAGAGWWLVATFPELARLFASEAMIEGVQSGQLWTDDLLNIVPSSVLSVRIFTNNIAVAIVAFCLGTIYGLGTLYIVTLNGLMLGSMLAFTARYDLHWRLIEFIVAHGFVELSTIFIASAAGFSVGEAIVRPAHRTRAAAFQRATSRGAKLILPCVLLLIGAGLIEGYVSPSPAVPPAVKLAIGVVYWLMMFWVLAGLRLPAMRMFEKRSPSADRKVSASS